MFRLGQLMTLLDLLVRIKVLSDIILNAYGRCVLQRIYITQAFSLYEFQILFRILILAIRLGVEVQLLVEARQLIVIIQRQIVAQLLVQADARLVRPAARHIFDRVATTA